MCGGRLRSTWQLVCVCLFADVNHAQGVLVGPAQGSSRAKLPASLQFNRRDESVHIQYGSCVLRFNVQEASDAALQPVPGEMLGQLLLQGQSTSAVGGHLFMWGNLLLLI